MERSGAEWGCGVRSGVERSGGAGCGVYGRATGCVVVYNTLERG